jgi:hypothetical protein
VEDYAEPGIRAFSPVSYYQRLIIFAAPSEYLSPCTLIFTAAVLISSRSSGVSITEIASIFSSDIYEELAIGNNYIIRKKKY